VVSLWYVPMYLLHGSDFLNTFLGVHNYLRATVSEHPMWDVWWYYSVLFFLIFFLFAFCAFAGCFFCLISFVSIGSIDFLLHFLQLLLILLL
jgi:hypothetical protein